MTAPRWAIIASVTCTGLALSTTSATAASAATPSRASDTGAAAPQLSPVPKLDVDRYAGQWYQAAAIPQVYSAQCYSNSKAVYKRLDADSISVRNSCRTWTKKPSQVSGHADVLDGKTNAQLRVTFDGVPSFGDPAKPNYVVAYLASDYSLALVGDPDRRSGFILSRTPSLTSDQWATVKKAVTDNGYQQRRFWTTPQTGGDKHPQPLSAKH